MNKKIINRFNIEESDLPASAQTRRLVVLGEKDAEFNIIILNSNGTFYDFTSRAFAAGFDKKNNLKVKMGGTAFSTNINFPAGSSSTYTIKLLIPPDTNTELSKGVGAGTNDRYP